MAKKSEQEPVKEGIPMPQIYYHKQLIGFVEAIEPIPIQESWIENIIKV